MMLNDRTFLPRRLAIVAVLMGVAILQHGCKGQKSQENAPASDEQAAAQTTDAKRPSDAQERQPVDAPTRPGSVTHAWQSKALDAALQRQSWIAVDEKIHYPDIATPPNTERWGRIVEKQDQRAEIWLYQYPKEGYAIAHERAFPPSDGVASKRQGAQLLIVHAKSSDDARALLDVMIAK